MYLKKFKTFFNLIEDEGKIINYIEERYNGLIKPNFTILKNEWLISVSELITEHGLEAGDMYRYSSWGYRESDPNVPVLFDYGLNREVWKNYYKVKREKMFFKGSVHEVYGVYPA